jgi:hypothetical protein
MRNLGKEISTSRISSPQSMIQSAVNNNEEGGRTEREESAKRDERLAYSSRDLSGHDVRQPLPSQCSLLFLVLHRKGLPLRLATSRLPRRAGGAARLTRDSDRQRQRRAGICRSRRPAFSDSFLFHSIVSTWVRKE